MSFFPVRIHRVVRTRLFGERRIFHKRRNVSKKEEDINVSNIDSRVRYKHKRRRFLYRRIPGICRNLHPVCPNVNHISRFYPFQSVHLTNKQSNVHTEERKEIFERVVKTVVEYGNKEFPEEKERSIHGIFPYRFINRKLQERINSRDLSALIQDSQKISPDSSCSRRNKGLSKGYFHIDRRNSKRKREEEIQGSSSR